MGISIEIEPGVFNRTTTTKRPRREKPHAVVDYDAKNNHAKCRCGFEGTPEEFNNHNKGLRKSKGTLDNLTEIAAARSNYFAQGHLSSFRGSKNE